MSGTSWNESKLSSAIKNYNKKNQANAKSSYSIFEELTSSTYANSDEKSKVKIFGQAMFYLALCNIHGYGVEQNKINPLTIANYLHDKKRYEDAWRIYSELAKDDEVKLTALSNIADYYIQGYVRKDDVLVFKIALEFYSKNKYEEAFKIFSILTFSQDSEIKFLATCLRASCYIMSEKIKIKLLNS